MLRSISDERGIKGEHYDSDSTTQKEREKGESKFKRWESKIHIRSDWLFRI